MHLAWPQYPEQKVNQEIIPPQSTRSTILPALPTPPNNVRSRSSKVRHNIMKGNRGNSSHSFSQELLRSKDPMCERADVRMSDDDLGGELDIERLLDRERDPFCLPLRPEAEVVGVAPIREPHYVFIFARLRDE